MRLFLPMVILVAAGTLALAVTTIWLGFVFHQFDEIADENNLQCKPVFGITGASDIEAVPGENVAYLSVYDERGGAERGGIVRFDLDNPLDDSSWRDRTNGRPGVFRPAGITLFEERLPTGVLSRHLFVVNKDGPSILIFSVDENGDLMLIERLTDPRLLSPNDVVATGPRSFYVTNDTAAGRQSIKGKIDFLLGLRTGQIFHFDGDDWSIVADNLNFPNGIALSPNGDTVYLAEMRAEAIRQFERDPATGKLESDGRIPLGSFPNNLSIDNEGGLLIGSVPQPFEYKAFTEALRDSAPSQVLRVDGGEARVLYQEAGRILSGATVATAVGATTLIGTGADDLFLMCEGR
ncbi:MAG: SMP-30/gluconolactonase/LRE family protein [Pseudomonadota bacterium]